MTLNFETPLAATLPAASGSIPDGTVLGPSAAGTAGNETKTATGVEEDALVTPTVPALHVIGLDVSLTSTGIACRHGVTTITSSGKADATLPQRQQRIRHLRNRIIGHITDCAAPGYLIVIEGPSYNSKNPGSAHDRSGLWWQLIETLTDIGLPVIEASPATRAKYATGKGNAGKEAVLVAAVKRLPWDDVLDNNGADAAWLCAIGHDLLGVPLVTVPSAHRVALDVLRNQLPQTSKEKP